MMAIRTLRHDIIDAIETAHPDWKHIVSGRIPDVKNPCFQIRFAGRMPEISGNRYPECYEITMIVGSDRNKDSEDVVEEYDEQMMKVLLNVSGIRRISLMARGSEEESVATRNIVKRANVAGVTKVQGTRDPVDNAKLSIMLYQVVAA